MSLAPRTQPYGTSHRRPCPDPGPGPRLPPPLITDIIRATRPTSRAPARHSPSHLRPFRRAKPKLLLVGGGRAPRLAWACALGERGGAGNCDGQFFCTSCACCACWAPCWAGLTAVRGGMHALGSSVQAGAHAWERGCRGRKRVGWGR
ncbi:hypothetical protein EJ06DRAFT_133881 [Trichodelitschia bisporula]|uniref:Uncharacterized protein n=1 Tax=Trichodelitschia bisporula TaxID=703511 RepID=A0A6G1HNS4_9PEZI|nr:hypothetical protein EJ06DRAFT_133881 [Trichodelitschia bisporula]